MLKGWNLEPGNDVVVDVSGMGQLFGAGELTPMAVEYPFHEITRGFRVMTAFHEARSLQAGTGDRAPGIIAQNLVQTSEASWGETDLAPEGARPARRARTRRGRSPWARW